MVSIGSQSARGFQAACLVVVTLQLAPTRAMAWPLDDAALADEWQRWSSSSALALRLDAPSPVLRLRPDFTGRMTVAPRPEALARILHGSGIGGPLRWEAARPGPAPRASETDVQEPLKPREEGPLAWTHNPLQEGLARLVIDWLRCMLLGGACALLIALGAAVVARLRGPPRVHEGRP